MKDNDSYIVNMLVLVVAFIFAKDLTWKLISLISKQNFYLPLQFLCTSFFSLYSLSLTKNAVIFQKYWEKHPQMERILEGVLHFCIVFNTKMPIVLMAMPNIFSERDSVLTQKEKSIIEERIKKRDNMPLIARCFMLPSFICIVWVIAQSLGLTGENIESWISKGLDFWISFMGLFFLSVAVRENAVEVKVKEENNKEPV